ncbi:MAG: hypothetical protein E7637_02445 [Ruminococcaceae bacterium]|nr:hypothetical protein [Oscillospiraceae bacterium]
MRKNIIKGTLCAIFPFLFNVIFFAFGGTHHPASVWISYAWIHVAYLIMIATPLLSGKAKSAMIYNFATGQISTLYFGVELIIGLIFIFIGVNSVKVPIIIQLIPFCLFLLIFLSILLHNEHSADNEKRRMVEIAFIKSAASQTKILMEHTSDPTLKNKIEKIYDLIHSSPSRSNPSAKALETNVMMMLNDLELLLEENKLDDANRLIGKIHYTMEKRNQIVAFSN